MQKIASCRKKLVIWKYIISYVIPWDHPTNEFYLITVMKKYQWHWFQNAITWKGKKKVLSNKQQKKISHIVHLAKVKYFCNQDINVSTDFFCSSAEKSGKCLSVFSFLHFLWTCTIFCTNVYTGLQVDTALNR